MSNSLFRQMSKSPGNCIYFTIIGPKVFIELLLHLLQQVRYSNISVACLFKAIHSASFFVVVGAWLRRRRAIHG